jgi:hypothetical protein
LPPFPIGVQIKTPSILATLLVPVRFLMGTKIRNATMRHATVCTRCGTNRKEKTEMTIALRKTLGPALLGATMILSLPALADSVAGAVTATLPSQGNGPSGGPPALPGPAGAPGNGLPMGSPGVLNGPGSGAPNIPMPNSLPSGSPSNPGTMNAPAQLKARATLRANGTDRSATVDSNDVQGSLTNLPNGLQGSPSARTTTGAPKKHSAQNKQAAQNNASAGNMQGSNVQGTKGQ